MAATCLLAASSWPITLRTLPVSLSTRRQRNIATALVTELAPAEFRTQAIGIYWSVRSVAIMAAPLAGGLLWQTAGPEAMLWSAGALGLVGTALFYLRFGRQ